MKLSEKAEKIRKEVIGVCTKNKAGHIAPSLSCIDILVALYYKVLKISAPLQEGRDRLVFSKAHGGYGLYAILCDLGLIPKKEWKNFYRQSSLSGCVEFRPEYGLEAGCGSLGHGLPIATGIAFGAKLQGKKFRTFCLVGDGEMQEGSNWEAIQFAVKHKLSNLIVIIDANQLQAMDFLENVLTVGDSRDDLAKKFSAFGFKVLMCDGHQVDEIVSVLELFLGDSDNLPKVLIAKTIKGYGLRCMENIPKFHFRIPTPEELKNE